MQYLRISQGSLKEVETHLIICEQVHIAKLDALKPLYGLIDEIGRMLRALIRTLEKKLDTVE